MPPKKTSAQQIGSKDPVLSPVAQRPTSPSSEDMVSMQGSESDIQDIHA